MSSSKDHIARELVRRALEFQRLAPWKAFGDKDLFLVQIPGEEHMPIGVVLGSGGLEFGFSLNLGPDAFLPLLRMIEGEPPAQVVGEQSLLTFSYERLQAIPLHHRRMLERAGYSARPESSAPLFMSKPAGRIVRPLRAKEQRLLLSALSAFLTAWQAGQLRPRDIRTAETMQTLVLSGNPERPDVRVTESSFPEIRPGPTINIDLAGLKSSDACWLVTLTGLDADPEGGNRPTRTLLVLDADSGEIVCCETVLGVGIDASILILHDLLHGAHPNSRAGLPREMRFSSKSLHDPIQATLASAGIKVRYVAQQPQLEDVAARLETVLPPEEPPEQLHVGQPHDPQLARWKTEEFELFELITELLEKLSNQEYRAMQRYFGKPDLGDLLLERLDRYSIGMAFDEWRVAHYRHLSTSPTMVETLLAANLSPTQRALLRARQQANPSLFKVEETDPAEGLVLLSDLFTGERVTVHDSGFAASLTSGLAVPLSLLPAGPFTFALPQGPPLPIAAVQPALAWLKKRGLNSTREAFARKPHLLGRLWEWFAGFIANTPPRLVTSDGQPFAWRTACFSLADPDAVRRHLAARDDVDPPCGGEEDVYHWFHGKARSLLGRIEIIGNELILRVNSVERLEQAQAFLESAQGVRLVSIQEKDVLKDRPPLDDRLPGPPLPAPAEELRQMVQDVMNQRAMAWLDEQLPDLGGKTPRQAARSRTGRQKVLLLIWSWPDQAGPDGQIIAPPRAQMLRELGLE